MKLFEKVKEIRSREGVLHFEGYAIVETSIFALYVHTIHKHDEDKHLHSHPWNFLTVVLSGCYLAISQKGYAAIKSPGSFSKMSRYGFHKIGSILNGPVKTLFLAYGRRTPWHFLVNGTKVESSEYRVMKHEGKFDKKLNYCEKRTLISEDQDFYWLYPDGTRVLKENK